MFIRTISILSLLALSACGETWVSGSLGGCVAAGKTAYSAPFLGIVAYSTASVERCPSVGYNDYRFTGVQGDGTSYQYYNQPFNPNVVYERGPDNVERRIR